MGSHTGASRTLSEWVDEAQAHGRYTFTLGQLREELGGSSARLQSALRRLRVKGRLASPRREFFVIVPLEYRSVGCPPASWFVDELMSFLGQPYYVGLLSAAAIHGAAHQHPQVFQVVTPVRTAGMRAGRVRIVFFRKRSLELVPTTRVRTETGRMTVSTPEATAFDLVRHMRSVGHLDNVATVLAELAETMKADKLVAAAEAFASLLEIQRVGYLLGLVGEDELASALEALLQEYRTRPARLRPGVDVEGCPWSERWALWINAEVDPDV